MGESDSKRRLTYARYALPLLLSVAFLVPFALRGARLSVERMENKISDWLPTSFDETIELEWFRDHFLGEQFVLVSWGAGPEDASGRPEWEACEPGSDTLALFLSKLNGQAAMPEALPDSIAVALGEGGRRALPLTPLADDAAVHAREIGERYGLFITDETHESWGGLEEKWLLGDGDRWYYLLPNGELYKWEGTGTVISAAKRGIRRISQGRNRATGTLMATVDPRYYADPRGMTAILVKSVTTGPGVVESLAGEGGSLILPNDNEAAREDAHRVARERMEGSLFNGDQTCVIVTLTERGEENLHRVLGRKVLGEPTGLLYRLAEESGIDHEAFRLGGPPVDTVAIDEEGQITLFNLVGYSLGVGLLLSYLCFRSVYITMMLFFVGGVSAMASLAFVFWSGHSVDSILMTMPSLVYVLALSAAVHIVNYYRDAVEEGGLLGAPDKAIAHAWWPCTLAAGTTSIGLFSLNTSKIIPIEKFGTFSAIGVFATLLLLFTFLPAALQMWPPRWKGNQRGELESTWLERALNTFWTGVGRFVTKHNLTVSAVGCLLLIVGAYGVTKVETSVQLLKLFDKKAKIIGDYVWLEEKLGKLVPMELVLRVDPKMLDAAPANPDRHPTFEERVRLRSIDQLRLVSFLQDSLEEEFGEEKREVIGHGMSSATFVRDLPDAGSYVDETNYNIKLRSHREDLTATDYLSFEEEGAALWRISLRLGALNDIDYGLFINDLQVVVEPAIQAYESRIDVLRAVESVRAIGEDPGFAGGHVYVLGGHYAEYLGLAEVDSTPDSIDDPTDKVDTEIDQQRIFALALKEALEMSGVGFDYHDPVAQPLAEGAATSERSANYLSTRDCVVLLGDVDSYDIEFIHKHARSVVDLRGRWDFDPSAEALTAYRAGGEEHPLGVVYTGIVPIVYKAQRELLQSLMSSTLWAFGLILLVMVCLLRSVRAGLLAMLPNVFPVLLIFGAIGYLGKRFNYEIDIGSMMTASVAMGVAVDDTIHFLTWFRRGLNEGRDRRGAIMLAYDRCATAMTQTTLIGGLGMAVFALSSFTPTQKFGVLMLALLNVALIGDLFFLPALLASPLGAVFKQSKPQGKHATTDRDENKAAEVTASLDSPQGSTQATSPVKTPHSSTRKESHSSRKRRRDGPHDSLEKG